MLTNLHVKNLALIDEEDIDFKNGLNILSGETGAGKSIVLGSINVALGNKASADLIRKGAEYALTELTFHVDDSEKLSMLKSMDIEELDEGEVIISRKITPTRSQIKVNGQAFTAGQTREVAALLLDIHGQHDSQLLMNERKHLDMIDVYGASQISSYKEKMKQAYHAYADAKKQLSELDIDEEVRNREISFAEYEINEIEGARLELGEDEKLEQAYKKMSNYQKIVEDLAAADRLLSSDSDNISDMSGQILKTLIAAAEYDEVLSDAADSMADIENLIHDVSRTITDYMDQCNYDPSEFMKIEQRLDLINNLKMKYGKTIEEVLDYCENKKAKLAEYEHFDEVLSQLKRNLQQTEKEAFAAAKELSAARRKAADSLKNHIVDALKNLNFLDVQFDVEFTQVQIPTLNGYDNVRFMISTNPGEDLKPLSKIASGGELSRIMLAIKTVIAQQDDIDSLIFDEIDAGISGKTAQMVANQLKKLSESHQIICITHLPQIASMADTHFLIEKTAQDNRTTSHIRSLNEDESVEELARMLGGTRITDAVLANARELKNGNKA